MQSTASVESRSKAYSPVIIVPVLDRTKSSLSSIATKKEFEGESKLQLKRTFSRMKALSHSYVEKTVLLNEEYEKAKTYLSTIEDPLWQHVCREVLGMMGAASFLKIWKSNLGLLSSQDKVLDITCETEEVAQFIQQYDFVILGSLQEYFPALKQLKAKTITELMSL